MERIVSHFSQAEPIGQARRRRKLPRDGGRGRLHGLYDLVIQWISTLALFASVIVVVAGSVRISEHQKGYLWLTAAAVISGLPVVAVALKYVIRLTRAFLDTR